MSLLWQKGMLFWLTKQSELVCSRDVKAVFFLSTEAIRAVSQKEWALLVARGINWFPSNEDKWKGSIDVWWVVRILTARHLLIWQGHTELGTSPSSLQVCLAV